jgi:xylulokinase
MTALGSQATFLSIDVGTSAVKSSVIDAAGQELQFSSADYGHIRLPGNRVEIEPGTLLGAIETSVHELDAALRKKVDVIAFDAFSPSLVVMDSSGQLVYPRIITHLDRRSAEESGDVLSRIGADRFLEITGFLPFVGGSGLLALLWLSKHESEALRDTYRVGHLTTFLQHLFTGEWATDPVNASMFGAYETTTGRGWSTEILEAFDLKASWFPEVRYPGASLGVLRRDTAKILGIRAGTPVKVGTNDMAAAHLGAGNDRAGQSMNTAGSSEMISILTDRPVPSPHYYLRCAAIPGLWQIYATTAGGFALDWFHEQFAREMSREAFFDELVPRALADHLEDDTITFLPYLTGDRQSLEPRTGQWRGLTLSNTREEMLAAMMKAMVGVLSETLARASKVVTLDSVIKVSGGMSSDAYLAAKQSLMPGFRLESVQNCSVLGNVALAKRESPTSQIPGGIT